MANKSVAFAIVFACIFATDAVRHFRESTGSLNDQIWALEHHMGRMSRMRKTAQHKGVRDMFPFYHTTDEIHAELVDLSARCPSMTLNSHTLASKTNNSNDQASIDVVTIKKPEAKPVNKNFFLFGEHARELISPESGLHLIKALCGEGPLSNKAKDVLQDSEFQIIVNGNPRSRAHVEKGDFCLRVDENGVDLNRNWDEEWAPVAEFASVDTNPGPTAFSEPETQLFKKMVSEYQPTNFLTIHSGTRGMYMPWAYDMHHLAKRNQPEMMQILKTLDSQYCECPFGAAGKEVGYSCPGTCLDWVYDKLKTPYSFAFEIYIGPEYDAGLKERFEDKIKNGFGAFYQMNSHLAHKHFHEVFAANPSNFVQLRENTQREQNMLRMDATDCFARFNPDTKERYEKTVDNWVNVYLDLAQMVAHNLKANATSS
eukprot:gnl/MRDRNA2_/MRDRNA2_35827_c0_seq1.p1 gnl/MRDRNA2_/MRDRNA2_35827_c0~~gnl/MRDRNA2_/MRDRNA2_35827_c0_seq1.p1  ORF type:complete len:428 (+),score=77.20 gnl/MRDRNA2_/MRDRNA2_35827_c0_seq1:93-1376(+)